MKVVIAPSCAVGKVTAPPSKSIAHRALICGALSNGSRICNISFSKDIEATLSCLKELGASVGISGSSVDIGGLDFAAVPEGATLFCNESGSTLRFMIPICMLAGKQITLTGSERLFERPLGVYERIAAEQGIAFEKTNNSLTVCGKLKRGQYTVAGDVSSQFITGLIFALSCLDGESSVTVTEPFESSSYVELTVGVLAEFGVRIVRKGNTFTVIGEKPRAREYHVEADCSNAAFLEGFNLLGGRVEVEGLSLDTLQGDRVYKDIYSQLGSGNCEFDLSDCPDLAPVSFALAAALDGGKFTGTKRLKIKESDRAAAMAQELAKFGIRVEVEDNAVTVCKAQLKPPNEPVFGHNDHRIVMSMALLCSVTGGVIEGAQAVNKSYPDFFEALRSLGIGIEEYED